MLNIIIPIIIGGLGYFFATVGKSLQTHVLTVFGGVLIFVAAVWFICVASYNIGYMLG